MIKKIVAVGTAILCLVCMTACGEREEEREQAERYENTATLAYIPIDDRPVNVDRVVYLAESVDYLLAMPESDLYETHLDNQKVNANGTQYGDRARLLKWLQETEADCYVLSLDQLLSGGLVNSRIMTEEDLTETYGMIDDVLSAVGEKPTIIFDTVMRLASTVGYSGYGSEEYEALRTYGASARKTLDGGDLTVENIIAGYRYSADGEVISAGVTEEIVEQYLAARERKLRLADYFLNAVKEKSNVYVFYGVDDSSLNTTVQSNEISYIAGKLNHGTIYSGCDELALMGVTKLYLESLRQEIAADVTYYGGGEDMAADDYDTDTLKVTVEGHLQSLGVTLSDTAQLKIIVLTQPAAGTTKAYNAVCDEAAEAVAREIEAENPVIVIDASTSTWYGRLQYKLAADIPLGILIGYSNWNTGANAVGCALANGIARYGYLKYGAVSESGHEAFLKALAFSYVKDIAYKITSAVEITKYITSNYDNVNNFYSEVEDENALNSAFTKMMLSNDNVCGATRLLNALNESQYITDLQTYTLSPHKEVSVDHFYFPWYRTFEASFEISLS